MDNLTHTLAGMLAAEAMLTMRRNRPSSGLRGSTYFVSVLANNFPDVDFIYTGITPPPLGYLLHHRGHTHTLVAGLVLVPLVLALVKAFVHWRKLALTPRDWGVLAALAALGHALHLVMDYTNNYGVHPFWPFFDGWFYGDAVFIVEPYLWVCAIPPLLFSWRSRVLRVVFGAVFLAGLVLCWVVPFISSSVALTISVFAAGWVWLARTASFRFRPWLGLLGCGGVVSLFAGLGHVAKATAQRAAVAQWPAEVVHDVVATPLPSNPLCWSLLLVQTEGDRYWVRRAVVAPIPAVLAARDCPDDTNSGGPPTAPLVPTTTPNPSAASERWIDEFRGRLDDLRRLSARCDAGALLRFARVPYWVSQAGGAGIVGDLRYDRAPDLDFADIRIPAQAQTCPSFVPSWIPPTAKLMTANR